MTIGIGVLLSENPRPSLIRPDGVVLLADTMGSTELDSTQALHKLCVEDDIYAIGAGRIEMDSEVISIFKQELAKTPSRTLGNVWQALSVAVHEHRMAHFRWDVIASKYSFSPGAILESQQQNIVNEWQQYDPGVSILISVFHHSGMALLFLVGPVEGNSSWVHSIQYPGYWALGTGGGHAVSWLNFRGQHLGCNAKQSVYHAYEANRMANMTPTVNRNIDMVIAFADRHYILTEENPEREGCPVSLLEMKSLYRQLGPQDTNGIGHKTSKPSTSQKSRPMK